MFFYKYVYIYKRVHFPHGWGLVVQSPGDL